ncbi:MAG: CAP domain-containing protein [Terriglobia bacterium]
MIRRDFIRSAMAAAAMSPADAFDQRIFKRINELREKRGAAPLAWSEPVAACAREQSRRIELLRFHGHNDPERGDISRRLTAAGVAWSSCGENLFSERGYDDPVHYAVVFWWYSPGHQQNLLNPVYTETGVGVVRGVDGTCFATQIFITPPARLRR